MSGLAGFLVSTWGAPEKDEDGNVIPDRFSSKPFPLQSLERSWNAMINYSQAIPIKMVLSVLADAITSSYDDR